MEAFRILDLAMQMTWSFQLQTHIPTEPAKEKSVRNYIQLRQGRNHLNPQVDFAYMEALSLNIGCRLDKW